MAQRSEAGTLYLGLTAHARPGWLRAPGRIPRAPGYDELITKLQRLQKQVGEDWDSYGGHAVPAETSEHALRFITALLAHLEEPPPAPEAGPAPEGGVLLRWMTSQHEVELAFLAGGGEYTVRDRLTGDVIDEGEIGGTESLLRDVVREYLVQ